MLLDLVDPGLANCRRFPIQTPKRIAGPFEGNHTLVNLNSPATFISPFRKLFENSQVFSPYPNLETVLQHFRTG